MKKFVIVQGELAKIWEAVDAKAAVAKHRTWMKESSMSSAEVEVFSLDLEATLEFGKIRMIP